MKFLQQKDGGCNIEFSEKEIEIITKNKKLFLPPTTLRHFGNALVGMVASWQLNFSDEVKELSTQSNTVIEGEDDNSNK